MTDESPVDAGKKMAKISGNEIGDDEEDGDDISTLELTAEEIKFESPALQDLQSQAYLLIDSFLWHTQQLSSQTFPFSINSTINGRGSFLLLPLLVAILTEFIGTMELCSLQTALGN